MSYHGLQLEGETMTRKGRKAEGKKTTLGETNDAAPYCGRSELSPADMQARRRVEAFLLMQNGGFRRCAAVKRPRFEPNDRCKRIDFFGRARALIGTADGISAVAPDDALADHMYTEANPFSDLNPHFADFASEAMGISESDTETAEREYIAAGTIFEYEADAYKKLFVDSGGHVPLPAHSGVAFCIEASRKRMQNLHLWEQHL